MVCVGARSKTDSESIAAYSTSIHGNMSQDQHICQLLLKLSLSLLFSPEPFCVAGSLQASRLYEIQVIGVVCVHVCVCVYACCLHDIISFSLNSSQQLLPLQSCSEEIVQDLRGRFAAMCTPWHVQLCSLCESVCVCVCTYVVVHGMFASCLSLSCIYAAQHMWSMLRVDCMYVAYRLMCAYVHADLCV